MAAGHFRVLDSARSPALANSSPRSLTCQLSRIGRYRCPAIAGTELRATFAKVEIYGASTSRKANFR
jgi:hypothetical protein